MQLQPMKQRMESFVRQLQTEIVSALEKVEGSDGLKFRSDEWTRQEDARTLRYINGQ